jgi:hypothetical protein
VVQEQKRRERSFISELIPDWHLTKGQQLWVVRIVIVIVVLLGLLTLIGLPFGITLWDWAELLIVPLVLAGGGALVQPVATRSRPQARDAACTRRSITSIF